MQTYLSLTRFIHPVIPSADLKAKPKAVQIGEEKIVLFRGSNGEVNAVEDRCPHRFTPLSEGKISKAGQIVCPYHGWRVAHDGKVEVPHKGELKNCKVKSYFTQEKAGYIWISENEFTTEQIPLDVASDWLLLTKYFIDFEAPFHVVFDNFSEDEHFPYVHNIFGWDENLAKDVKFDYAVAKDQIQVLYHGPQRNFPFMRLFTMKPGQFFRNEWVVKFNPPHINYHIHMTNKDGLLDGWGYNKVAIFFVPIGEKKTRLHLFQYAKMKNPKYNFLLHFMKPTIVGWSKKDILNDFELTKKCAHVPFSFEGMRLGTYDAPLVRGRELLKKIYLGYPERSAEPQAAAADISVPRS